MAHPLPVLTEKIHSPPLTVVLVEPQIPPNTGNIARLCAASGCHLILAGKLGFRLDDTTLKRAGLDYWEHVSWEHHLEVETLFEPGHPSALPEQAFHLLSTHARKAYSQIPAARGDYLVFGKETAGLPKSLLERFSKQCYTIPMSGDGVRSLNLSSAVAITVYDALRRIEPALFAPQTGLPGMGGDKVSE